MQPHWSKRTVAVVLGELKQNFQTQIVKFGHKGELLDYVPYDQDVQGLTKVDNRSVMKLQPHINEDT